MFKVERWIYAGTVKLKGNKRGIEFILLDENDNPTDTNMCYTSKKTYAPGCIYEVEADRSNGGCSAKLGTLKLVAKHHDSSIVEKYQLQNKLYTEMIETEKLEAKYKYGFELPSEWNELVRIYKSLNYSQREVFKNLLLGKLMRDSGD